MHFMHEHQHEIEFVKRPEKLVNVYSNYKLVFAIAFGYLSHSIGNARNNWKCECICIYILGVSSDRAEQFQCLIEWVLYVFIITIFVIFDAFAS